MALVEILDGRFKSKVVLVISRQKTALNLMKKLPDRSLYLTAVNGPLMGLKSWSGKRLNSFVR